MIVAVVLLAGCGSDANDTSESEESADVVATAEPPADPVRKTCSSKRENAGRVYEYDRAQMSQIEALETFCGTVVAEDPPARGRRAATPTPNATPTASANQCSLEWQIIYEFGDLMNDVYETFGRALDSNSTSLAREAYQKMKSEMSQASTYADSVIRRCPDAYSEALWNDLETGWNDLRDACRRDNAGSLLGGC